MAASLIALFAVSATGCTVFFPSEPEERRASFCVTQNEGESLLCCPSPGIGCQAVEATQ